MLATTKRRGHTSPHGWSRGRHDLTEIPATQGAAPTHPHPHPPPRSTNYASSPSDSAAADPSVSNPPRSLSAPPKFGSASKGTRLPPKRPSHGEEKAAAARDRSSRDSPSPSRLEQDSPLGRLRQQRQQQKQMGGKPTPQHPSPRISPQRAQQRLRSPERQAYQQRRPSPQTGREPLRPTPQPEAQPLEPGAQPQQSTLPLTSSLPQPISSKSASPKRRTWAQPQHPPNPQFPPQRVEQEVGLPEPVVGPTTTSLGKARSQESAPDPTNPWTRATPTPTHRA